MIPDITPESKGRTHLQPKIKVVLRSPAHNPMEGVDRIRYTVFCLEQRVDLSGVGQVSLDGDGFGAFRSLGFDDIGEDKVAIRGLWVYEECMGELRVGKIVMSEMQKGSNIIVMIRTRPPSQPAAPVMRTMDFSTTVIVDEVERV